MISCDIWSRFALMARAFSIVKSFGNSSDGLVERITVHQVEDLLDDEQISHR
jgi:hypothetical protein